MITGGWCVAKQKKTYIPVQRTPPPMEQAKKGEKKKEKKRCAEYRTRELWLDSLMVLPPTLHRHQLAKSIHATFLYPTARLPPFSIQLPAVQEGQAKPEAVLPRQHGSWERTRSAADARPNQLEKRVLPALFRLRWSSQSDERSARGRTRLTTVKSISCRSL